MREMFFVFRNHPFKTFANPLNYLKIFVIMVIRHFSYHPFSPTHSHKTLSSHLTSKVSYQYDSEEFDGPKSPLNPLNPPYGP